MNCRNSLPSPNWVLMLTLQHIPDPLERINLHSAVLVLKDYAAVWVYAGDAGGYGAAGCHFFYWHVCRGICVYFNELVPFSQSVEVGEVFLPEFLGTSLL